MIPLKDENPTHGTPWMTILLIVTNVLVSIYQWALPDAAGQRLVLAAALVPARLSGLVETGGLPPVITLITCQFLHGGILHLAGNMLFLWIFGNNVEEELGSIWFLLFYLLCGVGAGLVHYLTQPMSSLPTVGASGAISGVLGAYAILFPKAQIHTLIILILYVSVVRIPALLWVGIWFAIQLVQGLLSKGAGGGVAWFAHVGGLLVGVILVLIFRRPAPRRRLEPFGESWGRR